MTGIIFEPMSTKTFVDQLQSEVKLSLPVQRIVSLVPSQTELLFDLGLGDRVVGITKFCVHPSEWRKTKTIVGGTKKFNLDVIDRLQPDLILGNKEENYPEGIEALRLKYPVWMSDITTLNEALDMIRFVGEMTQTEGAAKQLLFDINQAFASLPLAQPCRVLYLIWKEPWMAVGQNTFIDSMLQKIGWRNVITESRYPELTTASIQTLSPDVILLSTEPFPFNEQHRVELQELLPSAKVLLVDGEMFSWYGSRLVKATGYFKEVARQVGSTH
jgi:ABC-type Fe3+-hydroxamate transport system substrate-binding protein